MKVILESTSRVVELDGGVEARVWEGKTDTGVPLTAFITRVAVNEAHDYEQFERELRSQRAPVTYWPLRMVL